MTKYIEVQESLKENQNIWLITGVAGFSGSNLLEKLLLLNQKVVGLDNLDTGHQINLDQALAEANRISGKDLSGNFRFINGDISNLEDCEKACSGVDYVLHQAALGSVPRSIQDPVNSNNANVVGFLNMLIASRDANIKRFVYAASSSTYGDSVELPKVEDRVGNPLSPYAVTKLVNELYASVFAKTYNFRTIGLRYFNVFGRRQSPQGAYAAVIPKWVSAMLNGDDVFINGDGETSRDFCYVENVVQMNILAATTDNEGAIDQVFNVALNDVTSLNELHQMIRERLVGLVPELRIKDPIYRDFRLGDIRHSQANIDKAKKLLGYQPSHKVSEGMDEAIVWYVQSLRKLDAS